MVVINGDTGIDKIKDGSIVDADLNLSVKPMFSAYSNQAQSIAASTLVKINFNIKEFDLTNAYDAATNYRFTPQKAGYYQVNSQLLVNSTTSSIAVQVWKNGVQAKSGTGSTASGTVYTAGNISVIIYLNGTSDFLEVYTYSSTAVALAINTSPQNYFQAHYIGA